MARLLKRISLMFSVLLSLQLSAQVTIGSDIEPIEGALLDLKEKGNTKKGLGLPRVKLINTVPITPAELAASIGSMGEWDMSKHIGLLVYNIAEGTGKCIGESYTLENVQWKGIHVWNGKMWQLIRETTPNIETDVRTIVYHEVKEVDGIAVGRFTMSYKDEKETYYYADFGAAGIWMTQNLRT